MFCVVRIQVLAGRLVHQWMGPAKCCLWDTFHYIVATFGAPMDGLHSKCCLSWWDTFLYIVATTAADACVLHHSVPGTFSSRLRLSANTLFRLHPVVRGSATVAAARPLKDILEMLKPLRPQSSNKTLRTGQQKSVQYLHYIRMACIHWFLTGQICSLNKNSWMVMKALQWCVVGYIVAHHDCDNSWLW